MSDALAATDVSINAIPLTAASIFAQIPNIPPSMIAQFQNLSVDEQRRLAQQYGIDMESLGLNQLPGSESQLGEQVEPISSNPDQILYRRLMQEKSDQQKLQDLEKSLIPVFERNYSDIDDIPIFGRSIFDNKVSPQF